MQCFKKLLLITIMLFGGLNTAFSQTENSLNNKYLLVLDLQDYYLRNSLDSIDAKNYISKVNYLISRADTNKVIYVKSVHKVLNLSLKSPFIYVSVDTIAMQLYNGLNIVNDNIYTKEKPNAFSVTELKEYLKTNNITEIVIIGLMAEECVYETSIGGVENGIEIYIVPEAIIGKSLKSKEKIIKKLQAKGVIKLNINNIN